MADGELWLDRARARRAGSELASGGRAISAERRKLGDEIAAASAQRPWGRDDIGSAFDHKYREFETTFLQGWQRLGSYVDQLGNDVVQAVRASTETDIANASRIQRTIRPR
ncbi:hypothetical protein [Micromonospora echinofusca]|uniref:Excreted virulence factor EspC, type VII ESX diderm n=1 Tax=Micromonospora echinofusca TaxID=47858 RepID=A0ABS3VRB4_MICEH|nr:hypothetical protein [Micromonospora echinofusca]MBO4207076.1 hypothetical protein [Micromonospora echinofusca]